jgi:hypothetical protein
VGSIDGTITTPLPSSCYNYPVTYRIVAWVLFFTMAGVLTSGQFGAHGQESPPSNGGAASGGGGQVAWNVEATGAAIVKWASDILFAETPDIKTSVLSVRDNGVFLDAGSLKKVTPGLVFEIYRAPHEDVGETIAGRVQVAWTHDDYCFASPLSAIDLTTVSSLYFARLVRVPPSVALIKDGSKNSDPASLDKLATLIESGLSAKSAKVSTEASTEPQWHLTLTPDSVAGSIISSLTAPGGGLVGTILLDLRNGGRLSGRALLNPQYISGNLSPFEKYLAPPGRRSVRIESGRMVTGNQDELAVLDGSDFYVYDLSGVDPRLLSSFSVSIPLGQVRHREDSGSIELCDLDGNGMDEVLIAPPGGNRGEVWRFKSDNWDRLGFISSPAWATAPQVGGAMIGQYLSGTPALDPATLSWFFPLTTKEPIKIDLRVSPTSVASLPETSQKLPAFLVVDQKRTLYKYSTDGGLVAIQGLWGNCVRVAQTANGPVALLTSPSLTSDELTILNPSDGKVLAKYPYADGPIIDIAVGDINQDGYSEILVAAIHPEGVRIYY